MGPLVTHTKPLVWDFCAQKSGIFFSHRILFWGSPFLSASYSGLDPDDPGLGDQDGDGIADQYDPDMDGDGILD